MPRGVFRAIIRLTSYGCTNRPFYHLVVTDPKGPIQGPIFEQVGSVDPLPNKNGEKLVGLNLDRIQHWLVKGAYLSKNAKDLLGLSGFLPLSPRSLQHARRKQIASALRDRVAAGETIGEEEVPAVVKYLQYHPIYETVYDTDGYAHESAKVDFNNFENNYNCHSSWSQRSRELTKEFYKEGE